MPASPAIAWVGNAVSDEPSEPSAARPLRVDGEQQCLGARGAADHDGVALLHRGRVLHQDLREILDALVPHEATHSWMRDSPAISGWNATASTLPCRTATGCPSISA